MTGWPKRSSAPSPFSWTKGNATRWAGSLSVGYIRYERPARSAIWAPRRFGTGVKEFELRKIGRRTFVTNESVERFLYSLPKVGWAMLHKREPRRRDVFVDELPRVAEAEALDDQSRFDEYPGRRFRSRRGSEGFFWIICKRGHVLLRTGMRQPAPSEDVDSDLAVAFFRAAYPDAPIAQVQRRARKALKSRKIPFGDAVEILHNVGGDGAGGERHPERRPRRDQGARRAGS